MGPQAVFRLPQHTDSGRGSRTNRFPIEAVGPLASCPPRPQEASARQSGWDANTGNRAINPCRLQAVDAPCPSLHRGRHRRELGEEHADVSIGQHVDDVSNLAVGRNEDELVGRAVRYAVHFNSIMKRLRMTIPCNSPLYPQPKQEKG